MSNTPTPVAASMKVRLAADDDTGDSGKVSALVSAYDVKYRIGWFTYHTLVAGAFTASIAAQSAIPAFHAHSWTDGGYPIGHGEASEIDGPEGKGLKIAGQLYVDHPDVANLYEAMKAGAIREYSIGYMPTTVTLDADDDEHEIVKEAELLEWSTVLRGANPETRTLELASALLGRKVDSTELAALLAKTQTEEEKDTKIAPAVTGGRLMSLYNL